jgi:N-sulfoglucosamine sulfohydrolase
MRQLRLRLAMTAMFLTAVATMTANHLAGAAPADSGLGPPNVLWLITEDMGPDLGCYGTAQVATPNLDRLASQGVRYTHAYTTSPVCSTSRSAFCTGMYQTSIGAHNHRSHRNDDYRLPEGVRVITDWLRDAGYFTANVGRRSRPIVGTGKTDWNFAYQSQYDKPFDSSDWADLKSHQPFYAQVNFSESHRRFTAPKQADPAKVVIPSYYPDHPVTRADWAAYLDAVSEADRKIGRVLQQLEAEGLADNTVVIFFGDHGRAMIRSKQWPYDSGLHIPLIIRWPKSYPLPDRFKPGSVDDRLIASIDITATTLSIAAIEPPRLMQGRPFFGPDANLNRKYVFAGRDRGDETVDRIRTVRDDRFRYLRNYYPERPFLQQNLYKERSYPVIAVMRKLLFDNKLTPAQLQLMAATRPPEELYDLDEDPYETNNLSTDPRYRDTLDRLRAALDTWIVETNDQGRYPERPEQIAPWRKREQQISQKWREKNPEAYQLMLRHRQWWKEQERP